MILKAICGKKRALFHSITHMYSLFIITIYKKVLLKGKCLCPTVEFNFKSQWTWRLSLVQIGERKRLAAGTTLPEMSLYRGSHHTAEVIMLGKPPCSGWRRKRLATDDTLTVIFTSDDATFIFQDLLWKNWKIVNGNKTSKNIHNLGRN